MGLDMYLTTRLYCSGQTDNDKLNKIQEILKEDFSNDKDAIDSIDIDITIGYWRKANHIHQWFVDNVQNGEDDCETNLVTRDDLRKLRAACVEALLHKTEPDEFVLSLVLPPVSGFFFRSTDYDDYYFETCEKTIKIIDTCLALPDKYSFYYHSSW